MTMFLKACRRCNGDLTEDRYDRSGRTLICLQCGAEASRSVVPMPMRVAEPAAMAGSAVVVGRVLPRAA